jgi:hypothetical protein
MSPPVAARRLLAGLLLSAAGPSAAATLRGQVVAAEDGAPVAPAARRPRACASHRPRAAAGRQVRAGRTPWLHPQAPAWPTVWPPA